MSKIITLCPERYLDVVKGKYVYNQCIDVDNGIITSIKPSKKGMQLNDVTLIPGLIDTHVHITYMFPTNDSIQKNQEKTLLAGFTTVRDLGSESIVKVYNQDLSPRILWSGKPIFKKETENRSISDCINSRSRSDAIKVFESKRDLFGPEKLKSIVKQSPVPVAIHAVFPEEIQSASKSGCRSIEHCSYANEGMNFSKDTYICPTFSNPSNYLNNFDAYDFMFGRNNKEVRNYFEDIRQNNLANISKIYPEKCKLVFGTDAVAGMHGNNQYEFEFLSNLGVSNLDMIRMATIDAADMLMTDKIGRIDEGCYADIIGVKGNPLKNINDLKNIVFVMRSGVIFLNDS